MSEPIALLFSTPLMSAAFSPEAHVQGMLVFEAALASLREVESSPGGV
jgi:hypothetical protein